MKNILLGAIFAASATLANAQDVTAPAPETVTAPATAAAAMFAAVCASPAVRSEKLQAACDAATPPAATKDGARYRSTGIGAEVNVIFANLELITG